MQVGPSGTSVIPAWRSGAKTMRKTIQASLTVAAAVLAASLFTAVARPRARTSRFRSDPLCLSSPVPKAESIPARRPIPALRAGLQSSGSREGKRCSRMAARVRSRPPPCCPRGSPTQPWPRGWPRLMPATLPAGPSRRFHPATGGLDRPAHRQALVRRAARLRAAGEGLQGRGSVDRSPAKSARSGYNFLRWISNGVAFWAVSDLNAAELADFVRLWRKG